MLFVLFAHLHKSLTGVIIVTKGGGYNEVRRVRVGQHRDINRGSAWEYKRGADIGIAWESHRGNE